MEIPGYGLIESLWDLRPGIREYTGNLVFEGKRVLEVGTASGFVCFFMEKEGANVVAFDLSDTFSWDILPIAGLDHDELISDRRIAIRKLNNGYWLAHRAFHSRAKVVYGTTYDIPEAIGPVDISTFCAVLLHLRDPFLALYNGARLTRETILVTEPVPPHADTDSRFMEFIPQTELHDSWWFLTPTVVKSF
ncbi:MAG: hypothetical protein JO024_06855, partial [Candidatus Eremiobacteraeota bacterium]|nr:hypothetical protein [Candidatus Eremiobacteraeota bacterium]